MKREKILEMLEVLERLVKIFADGYSSQSLGCSCGNMFYTYESEGGFHKGEYGALENSNHAFCTGNNWPSRLIIGGVDYVKECECWHNKAMLIKEILDSHPHGIAEYINEQKDNAIEKAIAMPTVD
jgi:hypothetical protein